MVGMSNERLRELSEREQVLLYVIDSMNNVTHGEAEKLVTLFVEQAEDIRYNGPAPSFEGDEFSHAWNQLIAGDFIVHIRESAMSYTGDGEYEFDYGFDESNETMRFKAQYDGDIEDVIYDGLSSSEKMSGRMGIDTVVQSVMDA